MTTKLHKEIIAKEIKEAYGLNFTDEQLEQITANVALKLPFFIRSEAYDVLCKASPYIKNF